MTLLAESNGDIIIFACHVTLQDHMIKALNDLNVRSFSSYVIIRPSLVAIRLVVVRRYNRLKLSRDLPRSHDQRIVWLYGWQLLVVSHHPTTGT